MSPFDLEDFKFHHEQLHRLARAIVGEAHADDVVQDAWAAALSRRGPAPEHWGRWMHRVTHNLAWKWRIRRERGAAREREVGEDQVRESPSTQDVVAEIEARHDLERAILGLDEPYRSVLLWRFYEGLSIEDVSRRAGTVPSTTRTHLQRGLDRLRARMNSERGPEWRFALVPLLRRPPDALEASATTILSGVWTMTWTKWTLAALAVLCAPLLLELGARSSEQELGASRDAAPAAALEAAPPRPGEPALAAPDERRAARGVVVQEPDGSAAAPPAETVVELVEEKSGLVLPGVPVRLRYAVMERRLFLSHTKQVEVDRITDEAGRVTLPVEVDERGRSAENGIHATLPLGVTAGGDVPCSEAELRADGVLRLVARPAAAFRVHLPEDLSAEAAEELSATLVLSSAGGRVEVVGSRIRPAAIDGRELLMLLPRPFGGVRSLAERAGVLKLATTPLGPSFEASFSRPPSLSDDPLQAVRSTDLTQVFRVVDEFSGAPVPSAVVSVSRPSTGQSLGDCVARWTTDEDGALELIGIPSTEVRVVLRVEGHEPFDERMTLAPGGTTELRLRPILGLREVELSIRPSSASGAGGADPPQAIWCSVFDQEGARIHQALADTSVGREGWIASATLQHVPSTICFLEVDVSPPIYDRLGPVRIEPGASRLEVDLGVSVPLTPVVLRLPDDARAEYRQRAGADRLYTYRGPHSGVSPVTSVPDDGRPVTWVVDAPGYVPAYGTEQDWKRALFEGRPSIEIAPDLQPGWGALVSAIHLERGDGIPFHFRVERPVEGVRIVDPATGATLGLTDATGFTVLTSDEPLGPIEAHYGGEVKRMDLRGARGAGFGF